MHFSHAIFALPFALVALLVALVDHPDKVALRAQAPWLFVKIVVAVLAARNAAMTFNRLVDLPFDRRNPRTEMRPLVTGRISVPFAWLFFLINGAIFMGTAYSLNPLCGLLSLPTLAFLCFYSWTKRFTGLSHFVLGAALGLAPLGAWIGVTGTWSLKPVPLSLAVLFWVAGFDMIYALQDEGFDRQARLHSAIVWLGRFRALWVARLCHALVVPLLLVFYFQVKALGGFYLLALGLIAGVLLYEHRVVKPQGVLESELKAIQLAFFRCNGVISVLLLWSVAFDLFWNRYGAGIPLF